MHGRLIILRILNVPQRECKGILKPEAMVQAPDEPFFRPRTRMLGRYTRRCRLDEIDYTCQQKLDETSLDRYVQYHGPGRRGFSYVNLGGTWNSEP